MGIAIGMAFQIKDDLFDYQLHGLIGKPTGNDIKEKKFTLPLIYALNQAEAVQRKAMIRKIKNGNRSQKVVNEVVRFVKDMGGISFAMEKMEEFKLQAMEILAGFPSSPSRNALKGLVEFTVSRNK
jgi:octaprenyl-diphosphate synthase